MLFPVSADIIIIFCGGPQERSRSGSASAEAALGRSASVVRAEKPRLRECPYRPPYTRTLLGGRGVSAETTEAGQSAAGCASVNYALILYQRLSFT